MTPKPPDWSGKTCVILASGPGLTREQVERVRNSDRAGIRVIAINRSFEMAPWADVVYMGDLQAWKAYIKQVRKVCPSAALWTIDHQAASHFQLNRVKGVNRPGLGLNVAHTGGNSGFQSINLAFLFGCRRILLLGFTMRVIDGRKHWHPDHPAPLTQVVLPDEWRHKFVKLADDLRQHKCEVVNCDPLSALTVFPMSTIEEELKK